MVSELHSLSERWFQAWLEKDAATVERLMAEDYLYIAPSGLVLDRQAILAIIRSPSYRLDRGTRSEVVVRTVGREAAVVRERADPLGDEPVEPAHLAHHGVTHSLTLVRGWGSVARISGRLPGQTRRPTLRGRTMLDMEVCSG